MKKYDVAGTSKTAKKLAKRTRYYIRVRAYAVYGSTGQKTFSAWSTVKTAKTKK